MASGGHLLSGLLQGFAQGRVMKQERERANKMDKLQGQLLELRLQEARQKQDVLDQRQAAFDALFPGASQPAPVVPEMGATGVAGEAGLLPGDQPVGQQTSILDMLADQQTAGLAMRAGLVDVGDLVNLEKQRREEERQSPEAMAERLQALVGALPGGAGGDFQPTRITGEGDITFERPGIGRQYYDPDTNETVFLDDFGNEVRRVKAEPDLQVIETVDAQGNPVRAVVDLRQLNQADAATRATFASPQTALPGETQQLFTDVINGGAAIQTMLDAVDEFSQEGFGERLGSAMGAFTGEDQAAIDFQNAQGTFRVSQQGLIKGAPSDADQKIIDRNQTSLPEALTRPERAKAKLRWQRQLFTNSLRARIAFNKGTRTPIPKQVIELAGQFGLDPESVQPWDGKSQLNVMPDQPEILKGTNPLEGELTSEKIQSMDLELLQQVNPQALSLEALKTYVDKMKSFQ